MEDPDHELQLYIQEARRLVAEREHLDDMSAHVYARIEELLKERKRKRRHLRGLPSLATVGTGVAAAWNKTANNPVTASAILAAISIAIASPFVMDGPRPDTPSVAAPPPPPMKPPTAGAPPTSSPQGTPPETTTPAPPDSGPTTVPRAPQAVPVVAEQAPAQTQPPEQPGGQPTTEQPDGEPDERNENPPPTQQPPDTTQPPEPEPTQPPPDCTGLHVDASPVAEACVLGESVLEAEVLG